MEGSGGDWMELAADDLQFFCRCNQGPGGVPWEDIKDALLVNGLRHPHHPNCWGALERRAVKAGWLVRVGYCTASSPESHGTEMRVYKVRGER